MESSAWAVDFAESFTYISWANLQVCAVDIIIPFFREDGTEDPRNSERFRNLAQITQLARAGQGLEARHVCPWGSLNGQVLPPPRTGADGSGWDNGSPWVLWRRAWLLCHPEAELRRLVGEQAGFAKGRAGTVWRLLCYCGTPSQCPQGQSQPRFSVLLLLKDLKTTLKE